MLKIAFHDFLSVFQVNVVRNKDCKETRLKVLELAKLTIHAYGFSTVA